MNTTGVITDNSGLDKMKSKIFPHYVPLKLTGKGIAPIVIEMEAISAAALYKRALKWVQATCKDPVASLKRDIKYKKIRVSGYSPNRGNGYSFEYIVEVRFKDGRYGVMFNIRALYIFNTQRRLISYKGFYHRKGRTVRPEYAYAVEELEKEINNINGVLHVYLNGKNVEGALSD